MSDPSIPAQLMIRPARELAGISMRELARRVGVSVGTMSGIETGKTLASADRLRSIAAELDTTVDALAEIVPARLVDPEPEFDWRSYPDRELDPALAAAIACFVGIGYHGATMRTVAAEAGLSAAGVYHHYPSKQSLLTAVFDLAHTELSAHVDAAAEVDDPVAALGNVCEAIVLFALARRELMMIVLTDVGNVDAADRPRVEAAFDRLIDRVHQQLVRIGVDEPRATAHALIDMCVGVCRHAPADDPTALAQLYRSFGQRLAGS